MVVSRLSHLDRAVADLLSPARFAHFRSNSAALKNSAVYEIPELLAGILAVRPSHPLPPDSTAWAAARQ